MADKTCGINRCDRPVGAGTHVKVTDRRSEGSLTSLAVAVCEEHWAAIGAVPYLRDLARKP
jgi:hypothetical protein